MNSVSSLSPANLGISSLHPNLIKDQFGEAEEVQNIREETKITGVQNEDQAWINTALKAGVCALLAIGVITIFLTFPLVNAIIYSGMLIGFASAISFLFDSNVWKGAVYDAFSSGTSSSSWNWFQFGQPNSRPPVTASGTQIPGYHQVPGTRAPTPPPQAFYPTQPVYPPSPGQQQYHQVPGSRAHTEAPTQFPQQQHPQGPHAGVGTRRPPH